MPRYAYQTFDVFTDTRFGGNPLAVILDARGLDSETMLQITREFNYSESTFVLPPKDPANTAHVRIFTPGGEVPFAGHPNVGTGYALARQGHALGVPVGDELRFEEAAGLVVVNAIRDGGEVVGGIIRAPKTPIVCQPLDPAAVAPCASLQTAEIVTAAHPPIRASVGLPFIVAEVASLPALERSSPDAAAFTALGATLEPDDCGAIEFLGAYFYTRLPGQPGAIRARMFSPFDGIVEDPATGSAAGALGGLLGTLSGMDHGVLELAIDQGVEMGRPSRIDVSVTMEGGAVQTVTIGGRCVAVMSGEIEA
ncbi:MAG: PhzF family phenazine biosynthesis protein [Thermomicrobiales bacterium]